MATPFLVLDVDGVLALSSATATPPFTHHTLPASDGLTHDLWLRTDHGRWLICDLGEHFNLVWATGWEHDAPRLLSPLLDIPRMPVIKFAQRPSHGTRLYKLPDVSAYIGRSPAAWIDDDFDRDTCEWAEHREAPTMLVTTDPAIGMTIEHVRRLRDFAHRIAS